MSHQFGFSEAGNLAVHSCAVLASLEEERPVSAREMAEGLGVSESHLRKVLQILVRKGILESGRGAAGGFELARSAASVTLAGILEAVDSMPSPGGCLLGRSVCPAGSCVFTELNAEIGSMIEKAMSSTTLEVFAASLVARGGGRGK